MKIEILGSAGATLTPRPFCNCQVCEEARHKGVPYSRSGPAYFVHDVNLLIDTPEEIALLLNRSNIRRVEAAVYSHWHPDHTAGMRVFEANLKFWDWPPQNESTTIYLPAKVAADFKQYQDLENRAKFLEQEYGVIQTRRLAEGEQFGLGNITVKPILLDIGYVYGFLLDDGQSKALIVPDEAFGWQPKDLPPLDVAIVPMGLMEFHPFTGERIIPANHPILKVEATFRQTLAILPQLNASQIILSHIEEVNPLGYDDYRRLSEKLATDYPDLGPVTFAHDQLEVIT